MAYEKKEEYSVETTRILKETYETILRGIGEDPKGWLIKTPERAAKAMQFLTQGYDLDAKEILSSALFPEEYSEMVIVKDIEVYSMCEHHILPFFGKAHVAYIPNGSVVGLSKIPRVVDVFARRLQVQERLTHQILDCIQETLNPLGAASDRSKAYVYDDEGRRKANSITTTSAFTGEFKETETRNEFLKLLLSNRV